MDGREAAAYRMGVRAKEKSLGQVVPNPFRLGQQTHYDAWTSGWREGQVDMSFNPPPAVTACNHGRHPRQCPICQLAYMAGGADDSHERN